MNEVLRSYWYPVAKSADVGEQPYPVRLLDEHLVLYRTPDELVAFEDLCIHRGVRLSLGSVENGQITCAYHGWTYAPSGECVRIPSNLPGRRIPRKARVKKYRSEECYGLIWVCLEEPSPKLPRFPRDGWPEFGVDGTRSVILEFDWGVNAARMTENSMDHSHFPFVHPGILGDPDQPQYPDVKVHQSEDGLTYSIPNHANDTVRHYRLTVPFTLEISVEHGSDGRNKVSQLFTCCPVSATHTRHWFVSIRNFDLNPATDDEFVDRANNVFFQDRMIVENQHPEELPIDITEELHLRGPDKAALEYRRLLGRIGVGW